MDELTLLLEETANKELVVDGQNDSMMKSDYNGARRRKRRLCPPEITFLDAIISFQYQHETIGEEERMAEIRFTARDALLEWAEAHRYLEMQNGNTQCSTSSPTDEYRGVSVKRTVDAKIWSNKSQNNIDATATAASNSEFYYDWTFSSPYAGTIGCPQIDNPTDILGKGCDVNNRGLWKPLQQSHIPFHLLQDTSQPILLYDDIHLYEDDLHDNGDVSLNIKVRVMPRCWYVLQRLFVRVDRVCVKCREVRYFCMFDDSSSSSSGGSNEVDNAQVNTIYRDVVWREAAWEELGRLALPMDPAAWREDGNGVVGGTTAARPGMLSPPPPLASMLTRLPVVSLPSDLSRFAYFQHDGIMNKLEKNTPNCWSVPIVWASPKDPQKKGT